jgi:hypothetical protein
MEYHIKGMVVGRDEMEDEVLAARDIPLRYLALTARELSLITKTRIKSLHVPYNFTRSIC